MKWTKRSPTDWTPPHLPQPLTLPPPAHFSTFSSLAIPSIWTLAIIAFTDDKCFGLVDSPEETGGEYNSRQRMGSVVHCHFHHPWDFFEWPQFKYKISWSSRVWSWLIFSTDISPKHIHELAHLGMSLIKYTTKIQTRHTAISVPSSVWNQRCPKCYFSGPNSVCQTQEFLLSFHSEFLDHETVPAAEATSRRSMKFSLTNSRVRRFIKSDVSETDCLHHQDSDLTSLW